jgi:hypothetical protein
MKAVYNEKRKEYSVKIMYLTSIQVAYYQAKTSDSWSCITSVCAMLKDRPVIDARA